jgi:hypothetical protein
VSGKEGKKRGKKKFSLKKKVLERRRDYGTSGSGVWGGKKKKKKKRKKTPNKQIPIHPAAAIRLLPFVVIDGMTGLGYSTILAIGSWLIRYCPTTTTTTMTTTTKKKKKR